MTTDQEDNIKHVTSVDVARKAGVSRSAVSRTFTPGASVSPKTREKVLKAADELGYRVNQLARSLTNKRSDLVGIVAANMDNPFRAQQVELLARELMSHHFRPILLPAEGAENPTRVIEMLLEYNVSGVIVTSDTPPQSICQECVSLGVPVVLINKAEIGAKIDRVLVDNIKIGQLAARALYDGSASHVASIGGERPSYSLSIRLNAFAEHCQELGIGPVEHFRSKVQDYEGGSKAAQQLLESGISFDGVFCATDYIALGFMDHLRLNSDLKVPQDLQIIGCDNIRQAAWEGYNLTTIHQDCEQAAKQVVAALQSRFETPNSPSNTRMLDVHLVERGTTKTRP